MPGGNGKRDSGTPYASSGLVWQKFGEDILKSLSCPKEHLANCKKRIDKEILEDLDKIDNGIKSRSPFEYISYFLPNWDEQENTDLYFMEALHTTAILLKKAILKIIREEKDNTALRIAPAISCTENIMEIPSQFIKWQNVVIEHNNTSSVKIDFVIFHYPSGGYTAQCVPPSKDEPFKQRISFPIEWAARRINYTNFLESKAQLFAIMYASL